MARQKSMAVDDETKPIHELIERWTHALRTKNANGVIACRLRRAVMYTLASPLVAVEDRNQLEQWFATWKGEIGSEHRDLEIAMGNEVAYAHGLAHMTGTKTDGEAVDLWFRQTLGFKKIGTSWKIAHEHASVPFLMDGSNKAALDLKP
jgi:ketosteroid isomerase-like protein